MASTSFNTSTPQVLQLGIQDLSTAVPSPQQDQIPTHLAKIYIYAQKGPAGPQLCTPDGLQQMYGANTFNELSPYYNHQTKLSNLLSGNANAQMIERMIPADAGPKANLLLSIDLLPTTVPVYQRTTDGTYVTNPITGLPVPATPAATVTGFIAKWVVSHITTGGPAVADSDTFGIATVQAGDQTAGGTTSQRYPILQWWASSYGAYSNNAGFRLYAPTTSSSSPVNTALLESLNAYPFRLAAIKRSTSTATPTVTQLMSGDSALEFVLQQNAINPYTASAASLKPLFKNAWGQSGVKGYQDILADLGNLHIYQSNIDTVLDLVYMAEIGAAGAGSDFDTTVSNQKYLFNLFTGKSSTGAPYYSYVVNTSDANAVSLNESTNLFAAGGSDGTMNNELFAGLVATAVAEYNNPQSPLMEIARNPESIIYDTGFPLATKYALTNFIAIRKDTFCALSTFDADGPVMSASDEAAQGAALRTHLRLFPESTYFGTPTVRGLVMARNAELYTTTTGEKDSLILELANKASKLMGSSDRKWKPVYLFDKAPNNELTLFNPSTINVSFTPFTQRNKDWANGINYPIAYSFDSLFFPGIKTAYDDDTSILTSFITAMACCELEKVGIRTWKKFTGNISLTPAELIREVNNDVREQVSGMFAGLYKIVPAAYISGGDAKNGYSWTLPIQIYGNVPDTVMTLSLQAYRMSALTTANAANAAG